MLPTPTIVVETPGLTFTLSVSIIDSPIEVVPVLNKLSFKL